jgi:hypothetical protein
LKEERKDENEDEREEYEENERKKENDKNNKGKVGGMTIENKRRLLHGALSLKVISDLAHSSKNFMT